MNKTKQDRYARLTPEQQDVIVEQLCAWVLQMQKKLDLALADSAAPASTPPGKIED